jgi:hypothetical protein
LIRAKRPVAANTVQASPAGEALLAVESSAMFVLIGSMPHPRGLPRRYRRTGKASSCRSMFEIGERAPSLSVQLFPVRRVGGRSRWHRTAHPAHADTEGRAVRPFVRPVHADVCRPVLRRGCGRGPGRLFTSWQFTRSPEGRAMYNGPGVRAGSKTPSPRLGCVRCESALLAGGLLRALLMAAAGSSTRPRGLLS